MAASNIEKKYRLGVNLNILLEVHDETQLELAHKIGLKSPNAISNYISGIRKPKQEIRQKLAAHFRITEEELMYEDFSSLLSMKNQLANASDFIGFLLSLFPVIMLSETDSDKSFFTAHEAHARMYDAWKSFQQPDVNDLDICAKNYVSSYEQHSTAESIANLSGLCILLEIIEKNNFLEGVNGYVNVKNSSGKELIKEYYLRDLDNDVCDKADEEINDNNSKNEFEESAIHLLNELSTYPDWIHLADYYMALRYMFGCIKNGLSDDMNKTIGSEMMLAFSNIGNPYANNMINKKPTSNQK